jgi:hypothetical protein
MPVQEDFDWGTVTIDPNDPKWQPKVKPAKKKWRRQFVKVPWVWVDRLQTTARGSTYRLALILLYEHWRTGGRTIAVPNTFARKEGLSARSKWNALKELEQMGLITVERRRRRSPQVSLLGLGGSV